MEINILASKSPRRKYLLNQIGFKFSVVPSNFKEYFNYNLPPEALAESLARGKAMKVAKLYKDKIIIGADTVVSLNNEFYGKPKNSQESFKMLRSLSGKSHEVITGVSLILLNKNIDYTFNQKTNVTIANMTNEEIFSYVSNDNSDIITVSKPSLKIEKKTTQKTPQDDIFSAVSVFDSKSFRSDTCFDNQNTTYQINPAAAYINNASNNFS